MKRAFDKKGISLLRPIMLSALMAFWCIAGLISPAQAGKLVGPIQEVHDIVYTQPNGIPQRLDIFINPAASARRPAPVLVYFHGGAWARGARPTHPGGFNGFYHMGFSVVSVDYRLADVATAPAAATDVLCALSWVKRNAETLHFDASRIVVYGTSAGGHLALLAGLLPRNTDIADPACGPLPQPAAILDFYGPADLTAGYQPGGPFRSVQKWIGPVADPVALARKLSPMTYVRSGLPPVFIVHGDADPTVPYAQSLALKAALDRAGVATGLHTVAGGLHGKFDAGEKSIIYKEIEAFLTAQGILASH